MTFAETRGNRAIPHPVRSTVLLNIWIVKVLTPDSSLYALHEGIFNCLLQTHGRIMLCPRTISGLNGPNDQTAINSASYHKALVVIFKSKGTEVYLLLNLRAAPFASS